MNCKTFYLNFQKNFFQLDRISRRVERLSSNSIAPSKFFTLNRTFFLAVMVKWHHHFVYRVVATQSTESFMLLITLFRIEQFNIVGTGLTVNLD